MRTKLGKTKTEFSHVWLDGENAQIKEIIREHFAEFAQWNGVKFIKTSASVNAAQSPCDVGSLFSFLIALGFFYFNARSSDWTRAEMFTNFFAAIPAIMTKMSKAMIATGFTYTGLWDDLKQGPAGHHALTWSNRRGG